MYFPFWKLHGRDKRYADQPRTIYSEVPMFSDQFPVLPLNRRCIFPVSPL